MAFNNGFPIGYQPAQMYYPPQTAQVQQAQQNNGIIWVQGEAGAKSYMVAPNNTVQLWDSESQTIYLKSADASGMPSMKIIDYTIRDEFNQQTTPIQPDVNYITKEDIDTISNELSKLRNEIRLIINKEEPDNE